MYRIELGPDDIGVFRSIEELATTIKTGVITSNARIYHSASDKWLPIEFHPHFKKAREMAAGPIAPAAPSAPPPRSPARVGVESVRVRTPLPNPSPVAGLPLIDVSEPAPRWVEPRPAPVAVHSPAPDVAAVPPVEEPDPAPSVLIQIPPAPPEPEPAYEETATVRVTEPELPLAALAVLPEPEREAIFLAADPPTTASAAWPPLEPAVDREQEPAAPPVSEEPRMAEPMAGFQLPRVDLRLAERRRPLMAAAAAVTLLFSTHLALDHRTTLANVAVPLPDLRPAALRAERGPAATNAAVLPASLPDKGSPGFGGASTFSAPSPAPEPPPPPAPVDTARPAAVAPIAPPPKIAIAAPKIGAVPSLEGDLKSAAGLASRYDGAYAAARAELDNGLKTAGFANLFATTRLQPDGLRAARASVGTASAYIQRYRRREGEIEQAYRDSFDLLATRNKWSDGQRRTWEERKVGKEHPEIVKLSSFLLQSLDSLYGLLAAHEGGYRLTGGSIVFDDATAARAYAELKPWLDRRAHAWADTEGAEPTTAARILRAMGTVKLPEGDGI